MAEPVSLTIGKTLAGAVLKAAGPRLKQALLGSDEQRAIDAALERAFAVALSDAPPEQLAAAEPVLAEFFADPEVSGPLVEVALARRAPNIEKLRGRLWALGFDPATFPLDTGRIIDAVAVHLTEELRRHAARHESPIFNVVALAELDHLRGELHELEAPPQGAQAPPLPGIMVGRESALRELKARLGRGRGAETATHVITAVRGWPGVGKTTLAAALAHDPEIAEEFPDGVLWATLSRPERAGVELAAWGRALGVVAAGSLPPHELSAAVAGLLKERRMLLVVDDVWNATDAQLLRVGGRGCALIITTRVTEVASALAPTAADVYRLDVLDETSAFELLQRLAPAVVEAHPREVRQLVVELEGLPLALQVAGHLLRAEGDLGLEVEQLLASLQAGGVLDAGAPTDRQSLGDETPATVAALLRQSTDRLPPEDQVRFALLGAFAARPATFAIDALKAVWETDDPVPTIRRLVQLGLLEPAAGRRFELHSVLVLHARALLEPA